MPFNKITIIIPTKDRKEYLRYTLKTCLGQDYPKLSIIICDDGSTDGSLEMVKGIMKSETCITLLETKENLGMMENFERGISSVYDGFVMFLGGDDGLMPKSLFKINELLNEYSTDLITWPVHQYIYPEVKMKTGQIIVTNTGFNKNSGVKWINGKYYLQREAKKLFYVNDPYCPMIYVKGIASVSLINKIKNKSPERRFYQCSTPDGYSGFILAGSVEKYLYINESLTIHGLSKSSQGLNYTLEGDKSKKITESFFSKHKNIKLHKNLGGIDYSPLISMMSADFLYTANEINNISTEIDAKKLIINCINELRLGSFGSDKIKRELKILSAFAKKYNETEFFQKQLEKKRNKQYIFEGDGLSLKQIYFDADKMNISNVYEASYFIYNLNNVYSRFTIKNLLNALSSSIKYKFSSYRSDKRLHEYFVDSH